MRARTLVTHRRYFGLDAVSLRAATGRVLSRVVGLPRDRARVTDSQLRVDFGVDTIDARTLVERHGRRRPARSRAPSERDYRITDRFYEFAAARIVEPLPRPRAKLLVGQAVELAQRVNAEWTRNPLIIEAVAPFGAYMSRDPYLDELPLGLVVGNRPASQRARWRTIGKAEGVQDDPRRLRRAQHLRPRCASSPDLVDLPRPFAVSYQAEPWTDPALELERRPGLRRTRRRSGRRSARG